MSGLVALDLGPVAHLELVNPPLNLFTGALVLELRDALDRLERADDVRAVVVSGRGERAFSAGSHVGEFEDQAGEAGRDRHKLDQDVWRQLADLPMPTIAAIEGHCLGGRQPAAGQDQLLGPCGADDPRQPLRAAAARDDRQPYLGQAELRRLGRDPDVAAQRELQPAAEAEAIGLVNRVVPAGRAVAVADEIGAEIASAGPVAVREAKQLIDTALERDITAGLEAEFEASERIFATEDMVEGARAFFEKRDPVYRGR